MKRCCLVLALVYVLIATFPMDASNVGRNLRIEEWGTEIGYFTSDNPLYKSVFQDRFSFWFDLPRSWRAIDASSNNDGYYLFTDQDQEIDLRFYGGYNVFGPDAEDFNEMYSS